MESDNLDLTAEELKRQRNREASVRYRERNREKFNQRMRDWRESNREKSGADIIGTTLFSVAAVDRHTSVISNHMTSS